MRMINGPRNQMAYTEAIALKATVVLPLLVLQKPHRNSKTQDHIRCLERRMKLWSEGSIDTLVVECRAIQKRLPKYGKKTRTKSTVKILCQFNVPGEDNVRGDFLHLADHVDEEDPTSPTVKEVLRNKHPSAQCSPESLIQGEPPDTHPVIFDSIDASLIRSCALNTNGASGPSGLDAYAWKRLCTSYKSESNTLCQSLALSIKRMCTEYIDPRVLSPLLSCRLIALNKNPGVRPIGISETSRRIMAKAALRIMRDDIQDAAGTVQLSAGQIARVEAAVHAVREKFQLDETEAVLIDASNAFNSLNRATALQNIRHICPPLSTVLINTYRAPIQLFVDGELLLSQEGTTQGYPLAMPMYALATGPPD